MKKFWSILTGAVSVTAALFLCPAATHAAAGGEIAVDVTMPLQPAQAYSSTFSLRTDGLNWASAETVVTSVTTPVQTFNDGQAGTATITVVSYLGLSTAAATGKLTISSNTALVGACISGGGPPGTIGSFNVCNPGQFAVDLNFSSNTAVNLAAAINTFNVLLATSGYNPGTVIYATAPVPGTIWNSFQIASSTQAAIQVATLLSSSPATGVGIGTLTGGQDAATFTVNGSVFTAFGSTPTFAFSPVTSTAQTATNIATAITNAASTTGVIASAGNGAVVFATATSVGVNTNYVIATSTQPALTIAPFTSSGTTTAVGKMAGGLNASFSVGSASITISGSNYSTGQSVVISTSGNVIPSPLIWGTTYFIIAQASPAGTFMLTGTSTGAVAGTGMKIFSSSNTPTTADVFTLTASTWTSAPLLKWVVSNDNLNWVPLTTTPFNLTLPTFSVGAQLTQPTWFSSGTVTVWDFGHLDFGYLGLSVTAPSAGAVNVQARVIGKQQ